jgi:nucleotide-binding universal stress UspA family protein
MRVVIAVDEHLEETPLGRVPELLDVGGARVVAVHVVDPAGREAWERASGHHLLRHGPPHGVSGMHAADRARGEEVLASAAATVAAWQIAGVEMRLLEGSPKHEIRAMLDAEGADVLVVFVRGDEVGPKSIHKEARFLIDHAPCAVLVVKNQA